MNFVTYIQNKHELGLAIENDIHEVILGHKELSRFGRLNDDELFELSQMAKDHKIKVVLEWDIIVTEMDFQKRVETFKRLEKMHPDAVRVQDIGVLGFVMMETQYPIQLILENGNHNLVGIKRWEDFVGKRLERLVLSIELTQEKISEYIKELKTPVEILGLGPILLFYSPRQLLSAAELLEKKSEHLISDEFLEYIGESEESPHKGFPLIQNKFGTFMFHIKDFFILDFIPELKDMNLHTLRLDLRFNQSFENLVLMQQLFKNSGDSFTNILRDIKEKYPNDTTRGYFKVNKTNVLFGKLKNARTQRQDDGFVGTVIDVVKGRGMAIAIKGKHVGIGDELYLMNPEGVQIDFVVARLSNAAGLPIDSSSGMDFVIINDVKKALPKSLIYKKEISGKD